MKKIVVVGGGTAGWLSALFLKQKINDSDVTLLESSEIGILGAGEGTTPHIISLLEELDIPPYRVIREAKGTIKNGILFTDWNGDKTSYFHPFYDEGGLLKKKYLVGKRIFEGKNLDNLVPSSFVSKNSKVKMMFNPKKGKIESVPDSGIALHFDARLFAQLLKQTGIERGIRVIDAKVTEVKSVDERVEEILLDSGVTIEPDFVIDCTGFNRLFIGKHFKTEWVSYKESIPNNRAIPFFLPGEMENMPAYTEAIAMKYGWVWKIPVQDRYGCGYVYDSNTVADEEVKKEIKDKFGEVEFPRIFEFEAGCFKQIWRGNCLALGLAAGFIEPLEATSIWTTIITLRHFIENLPGAYNRDKDNPYIDHFNNTMLRFNEEVLAFIYFHYITKRDDTTYWKNFKTVNVPPVKFKNISATKNNLTPIFQENVLPLTFGRDSLLAVGAGGHFYDAKAGKDMMIAAAALGTDKTDRDAYLASHTSLIRYVKSCLTHFDFLNQIKNK